MDKLMHQVMLHFSRPLRDISDNVKIKYLLIWAVNEDLELSTTFVFSGEKERNMDDDIKKIQSFCEVQVKLWDFQTQGTAMLPRG